MVHSSTHVHKLEVLGFQLSIYNFDDPLRPGSLAYYGYTLANHLVKKKGFNTGNCPRHSIAEQEGGGYDPMLGMKYLLKAQYIDVMTVGS